MKRTTLSEYANAHPNSVHRVPTLDAPLLDYRDRHHRHSFDPDLLVVQIDDATVYPDFFVSTPDGHFIEDVGHRERVDANLAMTNHSDDDGAEPVFVVGGSSNYYHWLLNWLPRAFLYELNGVPCRLLTNPGQRSYHHDSWSVMFPSLGVSKRFHIAEPTRFRRVFLPVFFLNPLHSPFAVRSLRSRAYAAIPPEGRKFAERIYVSRTLARQRRVQNEDELVSLLERYGFAKYIPEQMPFEDQVRLFRDAKAVVAPHGAGLANLVFARPGVRVLEIRNEHYTKVFWSLATMVGARGYRHFSAEPLGSAPKPIHRDMSVSISELESDLRRWFA